MTDKNKFKTIREVYETGQPYNTPEEPEDAFIPISKTYGMVRERVDLQATKQAKQSIVAHPDNANWGLEDMSNPRRIANKQKLDTDTFMSVLNRVFGLSQDSITVLNPREGQNPSSKFNMFIYQTPEGKSIELLLAGGGNAGEQYEQMITSKLQHYIEAEANDDVKQSEVKTVFEKLNINPEDVKSINFAGAVDTKRQLDFDDGPKSVGKTIADIIITMEDPEEKLVEAEYYISVKDKKGDTIYNGGNVPFIKGQDDSVVFDQMTYDTTDHPSKLYFKLFNIDHDRVARGLNEYKAHNIDEAKLDEYTETGKWADHEIPEDNAHKIKNGLASAWGYGYWYLREKKDDIVFEPILNGKDAYERVGEIVKARIKYPYKKSKQVTLELTTEGVQGKYKYQIAVRNTSGKLLPLSMKVTQT